MVNPFAAAAEYLGHIDASLAESGVLARGNIRNVEALGLGIGNAQSVNGIAQLCRLTVEVVPLDGSDFYEASCNYPIPQIYLPQFRQEGAAVAVLVDPQDPTHIAIDPARDVPPAPIVAVSDDGTRQVVTAHKGAATRADILAQGKDCQLEVLAVFPLGQNDQAGLPASGLVLTVDTGSRPPYQAQIGVGIPAAAECLVVVGAKLPGKYLDGGDDLVTPIWP